MSVVAATTRGPKGPKAIPALDPKNALLVQPFKRLVEEGFITELTVRFTPSGFHAEGVPDARVAGVDGSGLTTGVAAPLGLISAAADKGNLIPRKQKKNGKTGGSAPAQPLPAKSLTKEDLGKSDAEFLSRARAVATSCGAGLVGRARTNGLFDGSVTTSFQDWWAQSSATARAQTLFTKRYFDECDREHVIRRMRSLECPFRGTAEFAVSERKDEDDD